MPDRVPPDPLRSEVPIVDIAPMVAGGTDQQRVADQIGAACRDTGFFYVVGHGVREDLQRRLEDLSRRFFAQDLETKMAIRMERGGRAWRGYFPVGNELTSGKPDRKEGIYFGQELGSEHPMVKAGTPLHGANLFPASPAGFRETVLEYFDAVTAVGHAVMAAVAVSLASRHRTSGITTRQTRWCCSGSSTIRRVSRQRPPSPDGVSASTPTTGS